MILYHICNIETRWKIFCKTKNCPVKDRDEDKDFYIRAINPDTIEYGIGEICEDGVFDEKTIKVIGEIQFAL